MSRTRYMHFHDLCDDNVAATSMDLLQCFFGLKQLELEVYSRLLIKGECRAEELSVMIGRDSSGISRALNHLDAVGLLLTTKRGRDGGGYFKCYEPLPPDSVAELMRVRLDCFRGRLERSLDGWEPRLEEAALHRAAIKVA